MLVLLVIFMVTAPFLNESIDVDLPEVTAASASTEKKDKIVTVNQQGEVFIEGEDKTPYTLETLGPALQQIFAGDAEQEKTLFLRADKNVPYGTVVKILALAKQLGIARIGMITEPEGS
jgi:biopolymer transport protein TolR